MSLQSAALTLSWVVLVLLSFGFAAMMRQLGVLTRAVSASSATGTRSIVGLRLPPSEPLLALTAPGRLLLCVFVSPTCRACHEILDHLDALVGDGGRPGGPHPSSLGADSLRPSDLHVAVLSTGAGFGPTHSAFASYTFFEEADAERTLLRVGATPSIAILDAAGVVLDAGPLTSEQSLGERLAAARPVSTSPVSTSPVSTSPVSTSPIGIPALAGRPAANQEAQ